MADVYICDSAYHVLISFVKIFIKGKPDVRMVLCTNDVLPDDVIERIKQIDLVAEVEVYKDLEKIDPLLDYSAPFFKRGKSLKNQLDGYITFECRDDDEYYIFNDVTIIGKYLNAHKIKYNLLEDGLNVYRLQTVITNNYKEPSYKKFFRRLFNAGFYCYGQSKYTKTIEVNSDKELLINISRRKLIVKPRVELFETLTKEQKNLIMKIFLGEEEYRELCQNIKNTGGKDVTLLITQPLMSDEITSKDMHRRFYQDMVDRYVNGPLVIKPHPRDEFDYREIFPNAVILPQRYLPIETLGFIEDCHFGKALTWCSTSIESVNFCDEKMSLGIDYIRPYIMADDDFETKWSYAATIKEK